jgi:hypothetical protein
MTIARGNRREDKPGAGGAQRGAKILVHGFDPHRDPRPRTQTQQSSARGSDYIDGLACPERGDDDGNGACCRGCEVNQDEGDP